MIKKVTNEILPQASIKQILVLATSMLLTNKCENVIRVFYLIQLYQDEIQGLLDSKSEVNTMSPGYVLRLSLKSEKSVSKSRK